MGFSDIRTWNAFWISAGETLVNWESPVLPAPYFRKEFELETVQESLLYICGLGYHKIRINGQCVSDVELAPAPTKYDAHCAYLKYDVSSYLHPGRNTIAVFLGNGQYNCHTNETWHLDKATWRDYPKMIVELTIDGQTALASDDTWKVSMNGPITFDGLRNGEFYDARLEMPGWDSNGFDDSSWKFATIASTPGGLLFEQTSAPCRVTHQFPMKPIRKNVWDCRQNIAGRAEITVSGKRGSCITLRYGEILSDAGTLVTDNIDCYIHGDFQTERYILKGAEKEVWHSHFTYHGFRYLGIEIEGEAEIKSITAQAIHSDVTQVGDFTCSNPIMNALKKCTYWSYLNNLVGIPTDCPHREKHGWLNDTQLASDTGLFLFDGKETYREWMGTIRDCMRPSGEIPGIAPTSGWGFNWGNGPMMDAALFEIPRNIYIYRGDSSVMQENYLAFKQALDYTARLAQGNIVRRGLGDWCHPFQDKAVLPALPLTGWYYHNLKIFSEAAALFGKDEDVKNYSAKAEQVKAAFNREFSNGNGSYANNEKTALAIAVHFGFCQDETARQAVQRLLSSVRQDAHIADFGIVGAKFVPRVLAEYGYADDAFKIFIQEEFPGWGKWIKTGETTLCEDFAQKNSHNHIMYGDLAAWMMQYAVGICPSFGRPGFREVVLIPRSIASLTSMSASYNSIYGAISVSWKQNGNTIEYSADIPENVPCRLEAPDGSSYLFSKHIETSWNA